MEEALRNFELQTFSKFSVYQKDKNFGSHGAGAQLGGGGGGRRGCLPYYFFKIKKNRPDFRKETWLCKSLS